MFLQIIQHRIIGIHVTLFFCHLYKINECSSTTFGIVTFIYKEKHFLGLLFASLELGNSARNVMDI